MRSSTLTVDDAPAEKDALGSHEPIASAIHELIVTEPGGRTIGLEGEWGSGKSTVVALLAQRLAGSSNHLVVFDAWAHEGDPLRRSFLETLISSLAEQEWVDSNAWSERRDELAKRRRVETTRQVPKLEKGAIVAGGAAAMFAILLSVGAVSLEVGLTDSTNFPWWPGALIASALVGLVLVISGALLYFSRSTRASSPLFTVFSTQTVTDSSSETVESPDPTSIEFESTFNELMRDALETKSTRRLVLVVDNLDRVSPDDARTVWSTLQTFLHHSHERREAWLDSVWVILPYDRVGISRVWGVKGKQEPDTRGSAQSVVNSYIDKSIQLTFEVPLPLLSDWRAFLDEVLQSALPGCEEVDNYVAYRLYAHRLAQDGARAPSPRELKQYVNRIVLLHRRWQHLLPFPSTAYYACLGRSGVEIAEGIRNRELPEPGVAGLLSEDATGHLAAIAFNTEPARAYQLLLGPLIERALGLDSSDELLKLVDRPGFWDALLQCSLVHPGVRVPELLKAAERLNDIPASQRPSTEWSDVASEFARQGREIEHWPALTSQLAEQLTGLFSLINQPAATVIAQWITDAPIEADGSSQWSGGVHSLLNRFKWLEVRATGHPSEVCKALASFASLSDWEVLASRLSVDPGSQSALEEDVSSRIAIDSSTAANALDVLQVIQTGLNWEPFAADASERLRLIAPSSAQITDSTLTDAQWLLQILRSAEQTADTHRADLVRSGTTLEFIWVASRRDDDDSLGDWVYEHLRSSSRHGPFRIPRTETTQRGNQILNTLKSDRDVRHVTSLARTIERLDDFDMILTIGSDSDTEALASSLVGTLWETERFAAYMNASRFRSFWPHLVNAQATSTIHATASFGVMCSDPSFVTELMTEAFSFGNLSMYQTILAGHPDRAESARLATWVAASLSDATLSQWQSLMSSSDDWASLVAELKTASPDTSIGGMYAQALTAHIDRVGEGAAVSAELSALWRNAVVPSISPVVKGSYEEGVVRSAIRSGGKLSENLLALIRDTLGQPSTFFRNDIVDGLLPSLVTENNTAGLSWLIEVLENKDLRRREPRRALDALREVVRTMHNTGTGNDPHLQRLAELLRIKL